MKRFSTHISPPGNFTIGIKELWQYKELFYFFTWRDIKVKYKQTYLGILWALLQPLGMMLLFTVVFSTSLKIQTPIPYPIFVLSGLLFWNLFNSAVSHAAESMIQNANIIKKIYFPRLIIPCSAILVAFFDFLLALVIFIGLCAWYNTPLNWNILLYFPAGMLVILFSAFGLGSFLAALNVKYRDFRYVVPFIMQVLFFSSQVIYPLTFIRQEWLKNLLALNPLNAAIALFRSPFTGQTDPSVIIPGLCSSLVLAIIGLVYFRKTEAYFADIA